MKPFISACAIDTVFDNKNIIGITINIANHLLEALAAFDALTLQKCDTVEFFDSKKHRSFFICCSGQDSCMQDDSTISVPRDKLEIIRAMILDVLTGNGFPGYHFDIDLNKAEEQLSFVFQETT